MSKKLPYCYYGNTILRKKCAEIKEITDEVKKLAQDICDSFNPPYDVGLSAPQVGHAIRLFATNVIGEDAKGHPVFGPNQVFINPVLSDPSDEMVSMAEGCLSIPGVYGEVIRPKEITVEAVDLDGKPIKERMVGYRARVIMHENDHLNGVLFIDRMNPKERRKLEHSLLALKKKYQKK